MTRLLLALAMPVLLVGHDLVVRVEPGPAAVVLRATYDGADPAGWADVEIFQPGDPDSPYQTGATDSAGAFAFVPSAPGQWLAVIDDGYGHRTEKRVDWTEADAPKPPEPAKPGVWRDALTGIALLIGMTGIWLWRQSRASPAGPM